MAGRAILQRMPHRPAPEAAPPSPVQPLLILFALPRDMPLLTAKEAKSKLIFHLYTFCMRVLRRTTFEAEPSCLLLWDFLFRHYLGAVI